MHVNLVRWLDEGYNSRDKVRMCWRGRQSMSEYLKIAKEKKIIEIFEWNHVNRKCMFGLNVYGYYDSFLFLLLNANLETKNIYSILYDSRQ